MLSRAKPWLVVACAIASAVVVASCRPSEPQVVTPYPGRTGLDAPPVPYPTSAPPRGGGPPEEVTFVGVVIDPTILEACSLTRPRAFFDFDSAELRPEAEPMVDQVAQCFESGPLKGRTMIVVGHADRRGPDAYNWKLALDRAQTIRTAMLARGLPKSRVEVRSRGEQMASPWDRQSYQWERRIEIFLAP